MALFSGSLEEVNNKKDCKTHLWKGDSAAAFSAPGAKILDASGSLQAVVDLSAQVGPEAAQCLLCLVLPTREHHMGALGKGCLLPRLDHIWGKRALQAAKPDLNFRCY